MLNNASHSVIFTHPQIDYALTINTGANRISWSYNLNTQSYPTYAGEVVQVLSCNIDNLTIEGDVRTYSEMEGIYRWFLLYMQKATQGDGADNFVGSPVKMEYPHRGWTLYIKPIALPAMQYGRDVVVPTWALQAHIEDPDPEMRDLAIDHGVNGEVDNWRNTITANIGFRQANPFSDPMAVITREEKDLYYANKDLDEGLRVVGETGQDKPDWGKALQGLSKQMNSMYEAMITGDYTELFQTFDASMPKIGKNAEQGDDDTNTTEKQGNANQATGNG